MKGLSHLGFSRGEETFGIIVLASLLSGLSVPFPAAAQPKELTPTQPAQTATGNPIDAARKEWRKGMLTTPPPNSTGCFTATYPDKQWHEVKCKPSTPHKLFLPQQGGMSRLDTVGGTGPDFSATVTGHITQSEGSFDSVAGVTSTNAYSLQLNTDRFTTSTCGSSPNAGCRGWEQFIYESAGGGLIQYWLLGWGPVGTMCPTPRHANCGNSTFSDGWCSENIPLFLNDPNPIQCVINAVNEPTAADGSAVPAEPMTSLGQLSLAGAAAGGGTPNDSITVTVGGTTYKATGDNRFPDLGNQWQEAEFNVFGDGNSSQAVFNSGATLQVRTEVISGTNLGPGCDPTIVYRRIE